MKKKISIIQPAITGMIVMLLVMLTTSVCASADNAQSDFFREGASARAFSTGYTGVSVADYADALYWNPAGLAQLKSARLATTKTSQEFFDSDVQTFNVVAPLKDVTIGFSYVRSSTGFPLTGVDSMGRPFITGSSSETYTGAALGAGGRVSKNLMVGMNIKNMSHKLYTNTESGTGFDIGVLTTGKGFRAGMVLQNIGGVNLGTDKVPFNVRFGASGGLIENRLMLSLSYDTDYLGKSGFGIGADFRIADQFSARLGSYDGNFAYGFGAKIENFEIDYALTSGSGVNETNKFSLSYELEK